MPSLRVSRGAAFFSCNAWYSSSASNREKIRSGAESRRKPDARPLCPIPRPHYLRLYTVLQQLFAGMAAGQYPHKADWPLCKRYPRAVDTISTPPARNKAISPTIICLDTPKRAANALALRVTPRFSDSSDRICSRLSEAGNAIIDTFPNCSPTYQRSFIFLHHTAAAVFSSVV